MLVDIGNWLTSRLSRSQRIQALNRQNASVRAAALAERTAEAALAISIIAYRVLEAGG
jgi:hypothetical protein